MPAATYPPATRDRALTLFREQGLPAAHRDTGIPKSTILRWARAAGVDPAEVTLARAEQTRLATEASLANRKAELATAMEQMLPKLVAIAHRAMDQELSILEIARAAANAAKQTGMVPTGLIAQLETVLAGPELRDLVQQRSSAVRDLRLMSDQTTENVGTNGQVLVTFAGAPTAWGSGRGAVVDMTPPPAELPAGGRELPPGGRELPPGK